jgi:integrative and conjugative element protein (TIGR02256 family)
MFKKYINPDGLTVTLPATVFVEIKKQVIKHYPKECGGIFVGKIINDNEALIEKMMVPRKFYSTRVFFLRVTGFLNKWLERVFNQSQGELYYLGEWHSHPDAAPIPSWKDLDSMEKIAKNPDKRIQTPLLLIVGFNSRSFSEKFYLYTNQKLVPYEIYN